MLDAFAFKVQRPGVKINHAILIGGVPGAGKDSMIAPLLYAIGGENKTNCASVETAIGAAEIRPPDTGQESGAGAGVQQLPRRYCDTVR
jgi:hypothetical protein